MVAWICRRDRPIKRRALVGAQRFQKHIRSDGVAILERRDTVDFAAFFQLSNDAIQSFIRKFAGGDAIFAVEVEFQASTHLEVSLAVGVRAPIQPIQKVLERFFARFPVPVRSHDPGPRHVRRFARFYMNRR